MIADVEETDVLFENQQEKIISEIKQAKYMIWVAVAWLLMLSWDVR